MMKRLFVSAAAAALVMSAAAHAAPDAQDDKAVEASLRASLKQVIPNASPDRITATPVPGMYEVTFGTQVYYVSRDGRYLFDGELIDIKTQQNLTEQTQAQGRLAVLKEIEKASPIIYPAKGQKKHTVTVFTDIDCGYCRKLHGGMAQMNELGIEVRYLAFPRAGEKSHSFEKAVSVWCAEDRGAAMTAAKQGDEPKTAQCDNPVLKHMQFAQLFGIQGTPSIILEDGRLLPGYLPPQKLLEAIEKKGG